MEGKECIERFRTALQMFCGRHAFHNYTKRKQYIDGHDPWSYGKRNRQKRRFVEEEEEEEDTGQPEEEEVSESTTPPNYEVISHWIGCKSTAMPRRNCYRGRRKLEDGVFGIWSSKNWTILRTELWHHTTVAFRALRQPILHL